MKKLVCIILLALLFSGNAISQRLIEQKCYKKKKGECVVPKLEIFENPDKTYLIKEYNKDGSFRMIANSNHSDPEKPDGPIRFFSEHGNIKSEGTYRNGAICCEWKIYKENGELDRQISYDLSRSDPDTTRVFQNMDFPDTTYEAMPKFKGKDLIEFSSYIAKEAFYPPLAQKNDVWGKVYVSFSIDEYGNVVDVQVARGVDPDLDNEGLRVVRNSSGWTPGYEKGKPVKMKFTVPINFKL